MKIIDFRVRPYYGGFKTSWLYNEPYLTGFCGRFNQPTAAGIRSIEECIKEMDDAGVSIGVVPGRTSSHVTNQELVELYEMYPDRFIPMAGIDPLDGAKFCLDEIEKYVVNGPCRGIMIELTVCGVSGNMILNADDPILEPIFQKCNELGLPVMLTWGGMASMQIEHGAPVHIERVLKKYPNMRVALCHGGYPYVNEYCWLAARHRNLWLSPDIYVVDAIPGGEDYMKGANGFIKDRIIFGSTFPIMHIKNLVDFYLNWGLSEQALPKVMYQNALEFLGMTEEEI